MSKGLKEDQTATQETLDALKEYWRQFIEWLKPKRGDAILLQIIKSILKIPVVLLVVALSPVVILVLLIAFAAVL